MMGGAAATADSLTDMELLEDALARSCDDAANPSTADGRSAAYRKGRTAALRYARICALDQMATADLHFMNSTPASDRRRERTLAALRTIHTRLFEALRADPVDEVAEGYRDGIAVALELTGQREHVVRQQLRCAPVPR